MQDLLEFFRSLYTTEGLTNLLQSGGLILLIGIVFAETGLLVGFFLPGDSLLVTAGILSSPDAIGGGVFDPFVLTGSLIVAAVLGDQLNYALGRKVGEAVYSRPDGRLIKRRHFEEARSFYQKHGGIAIVFARFVPILRTFVPFVAGVAKMEYRRFVVANVIGGMAWVTSMVWLGYFLGQTPLAKSLHRVILVVVFVSVLPLAIGAARRWWTMRRNRAAVGSGEPTK